MTSFPSTSDSKANHETPEPARCPFTNPYGVFYTGQKDDGKEGIADDGLMTFRRRRGRKECNAGGGGCGTSEKGGEVEAMGGIGPVGAGMVGAMEDGLKRGSAGHRLKESIVALNALLDASYSHGFTDASLLPPPYEVRPTKYDSVLSPSLSGFATKYPMVTIAGLGAVSAIAFLGAARLTGMALRRMTKAGNVVQSRGIEGRLDDLERRLAQSIASVNVQRSAELEGIKKELLALRSATGSLVGGGKGPIKLDPASVKAAMSRSAPIAPTMEEARLSQVITEAVEAVMAYRLPVTPKGSQVSASISGSRDGTTAKDELVREMIDVGDEHAEALSDKRMDEVLDAIEQLQQAVQKLQVSSTGVNSQVSAPETGCGDQVMSVKDLAAAVDSVREGYRDEHAEGEPAETMAKELQEAGDTLAKPLQEDNASSSSDASTAVPFVTSEAQDRVAEAPKHISAAMESVQSNSAKPPYPTGEERQMLLREAAAAAGAAHLERAEADLHVDDAEKASREGERESMMTRMRQDAEDNTRRMKDLAGKTWGLAGEAREESETTEEAVGWAELVSGRKEALKGSESASKPPEATAEDNPVAMGSNPAAADSIKPTKPRALYGVDESGDWSFSLFHAVSGRGWHDVPIVLRRESSAHSYEQGLFWRQYSGERSQAAYSTRAKIYFYPEADMIELDGAMWRCGREGAKYVIRERL